MGATFEEFVRQAEPRPRDALSAGLASDKGREATAEALGYAWEHWPRLRDMDNPGGYLYVLGRDRGRRMLRRRRVVLMPIDSRFWAGVGALTLGVVGDLCDA